MSDEEIHLHSGLVELHIQLAAETLSQGSFVAPQALLSKMLLDHIIDLAYNRKVSTLNSLHNQISWAFLDSHGQKIIDLICRFCPPSPSSLFTTAPLQPHAANSVANTSSGSHQPPKPTRPIKGSVKAQMDTTASYTRLWTIGQLFSRAHAKILMLLLSMLLKLPQLPVRRTGHCKYTVCITSDTIFLISN